MLEFILIVIVASIFAFFLWKQNEKYKNLKSEYESRFKDVIDADAEYIKVRGQTKSLLVALAELKESYQEKRQVYDGLLASAAIYNEQIELADLGFYSRHFDYDTPERYKTEIDFCREQQKQAVKNKQAVICTINWTVNGKGKDGQQFVNQIIKLTLRAFNQECDAAIANTRWNNIQRMEARIRKACESINKLNETKGVLITTEYLTLKLKEFFLTYEWEEQKQIRKEEQADIRQQMREEAKLNQEIEKAQKEEEKYQRMLEKAQEEAKKATGEKLMSLEYKILMLKEELLAAQEQNQRAISMAQQTRSGYVYVISNIGSFGANIFKIGMTRRLEPMDRVRELGDASVPFYFDVHALIYSPDAPALEKQLHKEFDSKKLNLVNNRREFFDVSLEQIQSAVEKLVPNANFVLTAEAKEFRESQAIRNVKAEKKVERKEVFPLEI